MNKSEIDKLVEAEAKRRFSPFGTYYSRNNFIEGANFYRSLLPDKVYRWVKADKGELRYNEKVNLMVDEVPDIGLFYEETKACFCLNNGAIMEKDFHRIEWLEEIDLRNPSDKTKTNQHEQE